MSFNEFIKRIKVKHVLFGAMCALLVLVVVLFCIVGVKISNMFKTPQDPTMSTENTGTSQSTGPDQTDGTKPSTSETQGITWPTEPGHVHEFVLTESVTATCKNYGYNIYTCSCGKQDIPLDEQVEPYGHSYGAGQIIAATCTTDGYTRYVCSRCGDEYVENYTKALGHSFVAGRPVKATCDQDGYTPYKCSVCGLEENDDVVIATGHDYQALEHTDVSCTEDECTVYQCTVCKEINRTYGAAATGHLWSDWNQITDNCWTRECGNCGLTESSSDLSITNKQVSSDYVHDASGNRYKLHVIYVGTATSPDLFHYTINDYLDNGTLSYRYDPAQGLIVTYTTNAGENTTVTLPVFQSVSTTIYADPAPTETAEPTE